MPIRASMIRSPERKIRSFCGGTQNDSKNPLIWVSVVSRVHFAPTTATVSPYHRVFFRLGINGAITQPSQTWIRRMRINVLNGASRSLMMGIHYRASAKPSLQKTASKLDKRDDCSSYPSYNG